jgi:uncharacterized protein YtpQ (UPF0354 family)
VKLFQWRGRTSTKEFRKRFIEMMNAAAPHVKYVEASQDDLDLSVEGVEHYVSMTVSLHRAYQEFVHDPSARDEILGRWVESQMSLIFPRPMDREKLLPMIKGQSWLQSYRRQYDEPLEPGSARDMLHEELNDEFLVAYAEHAGGIQYLHVSDIEKLGMTRDSLRQQALANLRSMTVRREIKIVGGAWLVAADGPPNSSLMLDDEVWRHPGLARLDPLIVAAPERDLLVVATGESADEIWHLASTTSATTRAAAYPISGQLMFHRHGRFELLDPDVVDESHAIPNLNLIDVFAKMKTGGASLGITIASLLDASPRSVFRLFRKIDAYLNEIATDGHAKEFGKATPENTAIEVSFHVPAHPEIVDLLNERVSAYVESRGVRLQILHGE